MSGLALLLSVCLGLAPGAPPLPLAPQAAAADLGALDARLQHADAEERRQAVADVARLGTEPALTRLLGMLADAEARVRDEAQLALGSWSEPAHAARILAALDERRGVHAPWIAEAVGRLPFPLEADALAATLRARDPAVRGLLCSSVERLGRAGRVAGDPGQALVPALEALLRDREPRVRADALLALQAVAPARCADHLAPFAADAQPEPRAAAAIAAGFLDEPAGLPLAAQLAGDPRTGVRVRAAEALARLGTRASAEALVARLEQEAEPRVLRALLAELRALSGLRHGRDPRPWHAWAAALPSDWRAAPRAPAQRRAEPEEGATAAFAGLPIESDRVAFLIDLSGSMWDELAGGRTRKQAVDGELLAALQALPSRASFNVIPFTGKPWPWRKSLTPAGERSVRDAARAFVGLTHRGQGDYWGALMLALEDPDVDTVLFFGDGRPSGGERWNLELMGALLEHENRYRAVVVDAVLVDLPRRIEDLWSALTAGTGGRYIEVAP